jgi:hypothetical protein
MFRVFFLSFFLSQTLFAFVDDDIDGVENSFDLCPHTPFDVVVDETGCDKNRLFKGKLTFEIGVEAEWFESDKSSTTNLYIDYAYRAFDLFLSTNRSSIQAVESNDIYLGVGYSYQREKVFTKLSLGSLVSSSTQSNENYATLFLSYQWKSNLNFFGNYTYTHLQKRRKKQKKYFESVTLGTSYQFNSMLLLSLGYMHETFVAKRMNSKDSVFLTGEYHFLQRYYVVTNYRYREDDLQTFSLSLGVTFE